MPDHSSDLFSNIQPSEDERELGLSVAIRWIAPWGGFVLALMVGRVLIGGSVVGIGDLFFVIPLSWLVGWLDAREMKAASLAAGGVLVLVGLAIGLLA